MDIFAHALWTNAIYKSAQKRKRTLWELAEIFFWSNFPDFFSFGILFLISIFNPVYYRWHGPDPGLQNAFPWLTDLHHILYSMLLFFLAWFGIRIIRGKYYWAMGGWFIHIFIDIFTHKDFFPPHFLWPFFPNAHLSLISWANPIFMAVNYSLILVVYGYWYFVMRKKGLWEKPAAQIIKVKNAKK